MPRGRLLGLSSAAIAGLIVLGLYLFTRQGRAVGDRLGGGAISRLEDLFAEDESEQGGEKGNPEPEREPVLDPFQPPPVPSPGGAVPDTAPDLGGGGGVAIDDVEGDSGNGAIPDFGTGGGRGAEVPPPSRGGGSSGSSAPSTGVDFGGFGGGTTEADARAYLRGAEVFGGAGFAAAIDSAIEASRSSTGTARFPLPGNPQAMTRTVFGPAPLFGAPSLAADDNDDDEEATKTAASARAGPRVNIRFRDPEAAAGGMLAAAPTATRGVQTGGMALGRGGRRRSFG